MRFRCRRLCQPEDLLEQLDVVILALRRGCRARSARQDRSHAPSPRSSSAARHQQQDHREDHPAGPGRGIALVHRFRSGSARRAGRRRHPERVACISSTVARASAPSAGLVQHARRSSVHPLPDGAVITEVHLVDVLEAALRLVFVLGEHRRGFRSRPLGKQLRQVLVPPPPLPASGRTWVRRWPARSSTSGETGSQHAEEEEVSRSTQGRRHAASRRPSPDESQRAPLGRATVCSI